MKRALYELTKNELAYSDQLGWVYLSTKEPVPAELVAQAEVLAAEREMAEMAERVRQERDRLIQQASWRVQRHYDELALGLEPTEQLLPLQQYVQALRDVPAQEGFPADAVWPELSEQEQAPEL